MGLKTMLGLYTMLPHVSCYAVTTISADLIWWTDCLQQENVFQPIPSSVNSINIDAYSDASSKVGIGIIIRKKWYAWQLLLGWKTLDGFHDIGWAEAISFELLVSAVLALYPPSQHFRLYRDNKGVVKGWWNGQS